MIQCDNCDNIRLQTLMELRANITTHMKPTVGSDKVLALIDVLAELPEIEPRKPRKT